MDQLNLQDDQTAMLRLSMAREDVQIVVTGGIAQNKVDYHGLEDVMVRVTRGDGLEQPKAEYSCANGLNILFPPLWSSDKIYGRPAEEVEITHPPGANRSCWDRVRISFPKKRRKKKVEGEKPQWSRKRKMMEAQIKLNLASLRGLINLPQ